MTLCLAVEGPTRNPHVIPFGCRKIPMTDFAAFAWGSCTDARVIQHTYCTLKCLITLHVLWCALSCMSAYLAGFAGIPSPLCEKACHFCRQNMQQGHQAAAEELKVSTATMDRQAQQQLAEMRQPIQELAASLFTCVYPILISLTE